MFKAIARWVLPFLAFMLVLAGCGGQEPGTTTPAVSAAAKPQLIEFYADW